jgi:hypothetical protein
VPKAEHEPSSGAAHFNRVPLGVVHEVHETHGLSGFDSISELAERLE